MTEQVYTAIVERIKDEVCDVRTYRELCEMADGYTAEVIRRIVDDEESHARYLAHTLKMDGREMPADVWGSYRAMEEMFRNASER